MAITDKLKTFANKISGTSYVDNGADPTSALNMNKKKMAQKTVEKSFKPKPVSNGIGVGM